jgi:hypothetical protein
MLGAPKALVQNPLPWWRAESRRNAELLIKLMFLVGGAAPAVRQFRPTVIKAS